MWPYYVLVAYFYFVVCFWMPKIEDRRNWKYLLLVIPLFLFAAFRGNGNGDYFAYLDRGVYITSWHDVIYNNKIGMEIGYRFIVYIVRLLNLPRQFVVVSMNLISFFCITVFIKKYSKNWCMSLLLFIPLFFQFDMHAARAAVAIGLCALGFRYIRERSFWKYIIVIAIASMFHPSALVSIPLFFLYGKRIGLQPSIFVIALELFIVRIWGIYALLARIFSIFHLNYFAEKLLTYSTSERYGYAMRLYDPRIWIGFLVFLFVKVTVPERDKDEDFMTNTMFLYSVVIILFSNTTFLAYRLSAFYYVFLIALIPGVIVKYHYHSGDLTHYKYERVQLYFFFGTIFSALNLFYARIMIEYKTVFETTSGLLKY